MPGRRCATQHGARAAGSPAAPRSAGASPPPGSNNSGIGANALFSYSTGGNHMASGYEALYATTTGSNHIAAGYQAGYLTTGSHNIEIGNKGSANDHNTLRIGTQGTQAATFIAGIYNHY
jgi:hypothetical protein